MKTSAPKRLSSKAISLPIPLLAPVIKATLPENEYQETINKAKGILQALACLDK